MSGVWITGHMRSGTSMIAGLFVQHGIFFGDCGGPTPKNQKGNNENLWLRKAVEGATPDDWPQAWFRQLQKEGWGGEEPWGAKAVAVHAPMMLQTCPDVVVLCYRPKEQILASCERFGSGVRFSREHREPMLEAHWRIMDVIRDHYDGLVVDVHAPDIVAGDYSALRPAFDALDVTPDPDVCNDWVDPALFHG